MWLPKILWYIFRLFAVIISPPIKACLNAVTKYENGIHCIIFNISSWFASLDKFHTTGVAQKNSCITIVSKFEKSGTKVVNADVNLVNAIIKAYSANITYNISSIFCIYPNIAHTTIAIANKNIATNAFANIEIIGIISTGKTTFFTKYAYY